MAASVERVGACLAAKVGASFAAFVKREVDHASAGTVAVSLAEVAKMAG